MAELSVSAPGLAASSAGLGLARRGHPRKAALCCNASVGHTGSALVPLIGADAEAFLAHSPARVQRLRD